MEPLITVVEVDYLETQVATADGLTEGPQVPVLIVKDKADNMYRIETSKATVQGIREIFDALEDVRTSA